MATLGQNGNLIPESEADFADNYESMRFKKCTRCGVPFTQYNIFTRFGWRETQISGFCEKCFNNLFNDLDD